MAGKQTPQTPQDDQPNSDQPLDQPQGGQTDVAPLRAGRTFQDLWDEAEGGGSNMAASASARLQATETFGAAREAILQGAAPADVPPVPLGAVAASPADITDELERGGPAFGSFVKSVGLAVAEAQQKLDETLVTTAKALSDTPIDVIAVIEQEIDNNGQMIAGTYHKEKLPLVNYIMPTAYQWTRVFLQADMRVEEFNAANGFNIQAKSSSFSASARASYGLGGFGASGGVSYGQSNVSAAGETSFARDQAAGTLHMEATLEPRADVRLPQPFILQKGPRIKVTAGARQDILGTATPPAPAPVIGRKLTLTIELRDKANNPLAGKQLEYRISQPLLNYTPTPASGQTDSNGQLLVELRREGAAFDATRPPEAVTVNVWLGLINEQVVVNI